MSTAEAGGDAALGGEETDERTRAALQASEERLRLALQASGAGVWEWDILSNRVDWSPEVYAMFGLEAGTGSDDPRPAFLALLNPADRDHVAEARRESLSGQATSIDFRIRRANDGAERWIRSQSVVAPGPDGRPSRIIGVNLDVTDHYEAAAALRESEAELKLVTDALPELISFIDRDGIYRFANRAYETWYGLTPEDVIGRHVRDVVGDAGYALREPSMRAALAGEDSRLEVDVAGPDGRRRRGDVRYMPRCSDDGAVEGFYAFVVDVTERKAAEEALQRLNETLESEIDERTRALRQTEEALRQSQKMEAIGQLTGGIAHDFNNILAAISGSLEFIKRRIASGRVNEVAKYLDAAVAASKRAADLTQRLLAFARRQSLEAKPVDVNGLVSSMGHLLRRTMGGAITIETRPDARAGYALTDASQLESAVVNLALNARDAMRDGGQLILETSRIDAAGPDLPELKHGQAYVAIRVTDTGEGMSQDVLTRAFDPFFTTKPIGEGSGLGLSMVYGFTHQTGGHIAVASTVGLGTSVTLYLPAFQGADPVVVIGATGDETPRAVPGETILVVEDEAPVRRLIVELLEELGYQMQEAHDAAGAMPVLEGRGRLDILISDLGLPGIGGRDLADAARSLRPGLPVLFITGYAQGAAAREGFLADRMELVAKPFSFDTLARRIRKLIDQG
jgi:PAS domain S-box-containing protein